MKWAILISVHMRIKIPSGPQERKEKTRDHECIARGVQGWDPAALLVLDCLLWAYTFPSPTHGVTSVVLGSLASGMGPQHN